MRSRAVIEQAKGVLAAAQKRDPEEAWQDLVRLSQQTNRKLRDVAADIVERAAKGELDLDEPE
jgi:AmiR/NasT family two-component response regulator